MSHHVASGFWISCFISTKAWLLNLALLLYRPRPEGVGCWAFWQQILWCICTAMTKCTRPYVCRKRVFNQHLCLFQPSLKYAAQNVSMCDNNVFEFIGGTWRFKLIKHHSKCFIRMCRFSFLKKLCNWCWVEYLFNDDCFWESNDW